MNKNQNQKKILIKTTVYLLYGRNEEKTTKTNVHFIPQFVVTPSNISARDFDLPRLFLFIGVGTLL